MSNLKRNSQIEGKKFCHLHRTMRNMLVVVLPQELRTSQLYFPDSFLLICVSSHVIPIVRTPVLTSVHVTDGVGLPETLHVKVLFSPSVTVMFSSEETTAGTV